MMREMIHACLQNALHVIATTYKKRWQVEAFHQSLKSNAGMAKSPTQTLRIQSSHIFIAIYAVFKLECLSVRSEINFFALRLKLLINATRSAFGQLQEFQAAAQGQLLNCPGQ